MTNDRHGPEESDGAAQPDQSSFDRIAPPDPLRPLRRELRGKRALYSVDSEANPTPLLIVDCERCEVERGLTARDMPTLLRSPCLLNPCRRTLWARCPTCRRYTWLRVRLGPGIPWPFRPGSLLPPRDGVARR